MNLKNDVKQWLPLESNPVSLNTYIETLGFQTSKYQFVDVLSTEQWAIDMIPQPVLAILFLFPMKKQNRSPSKKIQTTFTKKKDLYSDVWYMKQRIRNACGTFAILHALANLPSSIQSQDQLFQSSSWIERFLKECSSLNDHDENLPLERAKIFESDNEIDSLHDASAKDCDNQTRRGSMNDAVDIHFIAFVNKNDQLYELDGRNEIGPILHRQTNQNYFLKHTCEIIKNNFMNLDPEEVRFSILALTPI